MQIYIYVNTYLYVSKVHALIFMYIRQKLAFLIGTEGHGNGKYIITVEQPAAGSRRPADSSWQLRFPLE